MPVRDSYTGMNRLEFIIDQIAQTRRYTQGFIDVLDPGDWFHMPPGGVSFIAWQVGHLASSQYHLCLSRIRGTRPEDDALIPKDYFALFGKGSIPEANASRYPSAEEIRAVFDRVHAQVARELPGLDDAALDEPVTRRHPLFTTKFGSLAMCPRHEMLHAGQIGLIRRQFGHAPLR